MKDKLLKVTFTDGRKMTLEPGIIFTGTDLVTGERMKYVIFTDHRSTGPFLAKRKICYYFKIDAAGKIIYSDNDPDYEYEFVVETFADVMDCATSGLLCLFELERGGIKQVQIV